MNSLWRDGVFSPYARNIFRQTVHLAARETTPEDAAHQALHRFLASLNVFPSYISTYDITFSPLILGYNSLQPFYGGRNEVVSLIISSPATV